MAVSLRIRVDSEAAEATLAALDLRMGEGRRAVGRALDRMAFRVQQDAALNQIIRGGSGPPHPTRLTSRTGTLRRSIRVNRRGPYERSVGTDLLYGLVHELGGRIHPPRPYLAPALQKVFPRFADDLRREVQALIDGAPG